MTLLIAWLLCLVLGNMSTASVADEDDCEAQSSLLQVDVQVKNSDNRSILPDTLGGPLLDCNRDYILIFTPPKTGSTSMAASLDDLCQLDTKWTPETNVSYPRSIKPDNEATVAKDFLSKVPDASTVWLFTMVRNPFARAPSEFFQFPSIGWQLSMSYDVIPTMQTFALKFREYLPNWMQEEAEFYGNFMDVTGVELSGDAFDHSEHHMFTSKKVGTKTLNIVQLRVEDSDFWEHVLTKYIPGFVLKTGNDKSDIQDTLTKVEQEHSDAEQYAEFKEYFQYSDKEKYEMLKLDVLNFYTKAEMDSMVSAQMVAYQR